MNGGIGYSLGLLISKDIARNAIKELLDKQVRCDYGNFQCTRSGKIFENGSMYLTKRINF